MTRSRLIFAACLLLLVLYASPAALANVDDEEASERATIAGVLKKWQPISLSFTGPYASETDNSPNPFLDYRLQVAFAGPDGQTYNVQGFFDGDGSGGSAGDVWRVRFSPDDAGT